MAVYKPKRREFAKFLVGPPTKRIAKDAGDHYAAVLRTLAPHESGRYRRSIYVEVKVAPSYKPRWAAHIGSKVPYARVLEVGDKRHPNPPRPLNRLLDVIDADDPNKSRQAHRKANRG